MNANFVTALKACEQNALYEFGRVKQARGRVLIYFYEASDHHYLSLAR